MGAQYLGIVGIQVTLSLRTSVSLTTSGTIGDQIQVSGVVDLTNASLDAHSASSAPQQLKKPQLKVTFDIADNSVSSSFSTHTNGQTVAAALLIPTMSPKE